MKRAGPGKGSWFASGGGAGEVVVYFGPIDHIPKSGDVIGPAVLVIEVVGMFPDIETEDGNAGTSGDGIAHLGIILIGGGANGDRAIRFDDQPCPAGAKSAGGGGGKLFFEFVEAAEGGLDLIGEGTGRLAAALGGEDGPEEAVVGMAPAIIAHGGADGIGKIRDFGDQVVYTFRCIDIGGSDGIV